MRTSPEFMIAFVLGLATLVACARSKEATQSHVAPPAASTAQVSTTPMSPVFRGGIALPPAPAHPYDPIGAGIYAEQKRCNPYHRLIFFQNKESGFCFGYVWTGDKDNANYAVGGGSLVRMACDEVSTILCPEPDYAQPHPID